MHVCACVGGGGGSIKSVNKCIKMKRRKIHVYMPVVAYVDVVRMNSLNIMACIQSHLFITTRSTTCHI